MNTTAERTAPPAPKHYALCENQGLQVCASCSRNVENHPRIAEHQPMLSPALAEGGRCGDWRA